MAASNTIHLDNKICKRLGSASNLNANCECGFIVGSNKIILDIVSDLANSKSSTWPVLTVENAIKLRFSLPFGIDYVGFWFLSEDDNFHPQLKDLLQNSIPYLPSSNPDQIVTKPVNFIVLHWQKKTKVLSAFHVDKGQITETNVMEDGVEIDTYKKNLLYLRLNASEKIEFEDETELKREINHLQSAFNESVFRIADSDRVITNSDAFNHNYSHLQTNDMLNPFPVHLFHSLVNNKNEEKPCPLFSYSRRQGHFKTIGLHFDMLLVLSQAISIKEMWYQLNCALKVSLNAWQLTYTNIKKPLKTFHFKPFNCNTAISTWMSTDNDNKNERLSLHRVHLLSDESPAFRRTMALFTPYGEDSCIVNPHTSIIPRTSPTTRQMAVVDGYYAYRHYMQDGMNDDGWGCAYRSLQTIISWFKRQGYTQHPVPTHADIQKALVAIGDKPSKIIGSKHWIGSFEVSLCLEQMLNVQSRIIHCGSGSEVSLKARELLQHFREHGTPIMIGGGVLAHTIIGIELDELSGDVSYLILDPHYTGLEDLKVILKKGWCGWKKNSFWDKTAHYNLCLPLTPKEF